MRDLDDWALVARAQSGDSDAFALLVHRYHAPVIHFCYRMAGSRQDAEDVAQEVFLRLHRYLNRLNPQAKFSTVLFGIARNMTLNYLRDMNRRGRGRSQPLDSMAELESNTGRPAHEARMREIESHVEAALKRLSPEHRMVIHLREVEGMDYDGIAEVLRCRKGTVKSRLARAREQLRIVLIEQGGELL